MQRRLYGYRTIEMGIAAAIARLGEVVESASPAQTILVRALGVPLRREVEVVFGDVAEIGGGASVPMTFHDALHPDWFPIFEGAVDVLGVDDDAALTQLTVVGSYTPPFGHIGQVGDTFVLGRRMGEATVLAILDSLAAMLVPERPHQPR